MAQISLTFPDGNARDYEAGVTAAEVAESISKSLAKKAISATVNGRALRPAMADHGRCQHRHSHHAGRCPSAGTDPP